MSTRNVTGTVRKPNGEPWPEVIVRFQLSPGSFTSTDQYPRETTEVWTDANGEFTAPLWANEEGETASTYTCSLPGGDRFSFTLPVGDESDIALSLLRQGGVTSSDTQYNTVLTWLSDQGGALTDRANDFGANAQSGPFLDKGGAVYNVKHPDFGAVGDGSTDDAAALSAALTAALADNGVVYLPPGTYRYSSLPFDITDRVEIRGAGKRQTFLKPTSAYAGWAIRINDVWRNDGELGAGSSAANTLDLSVNKAGVVLRDFSVVGDRQYDASGITTFDRVDFLHMENVEVLYVKGVGLSLGKNGGATNLGLVRESTFVNVGVLMCGDLAGGDAPWEISTGSSTGDGTNQLRFINPHFLYNFAPAKIENQNATHPIRRVRFHSTMLHGWNDDATYEFAGDVLTIEGKVDDVKFFGLETNGSHDVGGVKYACVRLQSDGSDWPSMVEVYGLDIRSAAGDGVVVDEVDRLKLIGTIGAGVLGNPVEINGVVSEWFTHLDATGGTDPVTVANSTQEGLGVAIRNGVLKQRGARTNISTKTASYTVTRYDHTIIASGASAAVDITLPAVATVPGQTYVVKAVNIANTVRVVPDGSELIDGATSYTFASAQESITIQSDGAAWRIIGKKA